MWSSKLSSNAAVSRTQLGTILDFTSSSKCIVLEPRLIKPLERICGAQWLRSKGVEKIFKLEDVAPDYNDTTYYLIYTNYATFKKVVNNIRSKVDQENPIKDRFHIVVVPKSLFILENTLEELGLHGIVTLYSLQWFPIYLDNKIISLEVPDIYKMLYIDRDLSLLPIFAKSLWHLSFITGKPKFYFGLGRHSVATIQQLNKLYESPDNNTAKLNTDVGAVVLLDRCMDYPSALLTPTTYAALLNDVYKVHCGFCEHKANETESKYDNRNLPIINKEPVKFILDSRIDSVYNDIKNRHFTEVTSILSTLIKGLRVEGESSKEMTLDEIKKYVATQLQESTSKKKFIVNHLNASQTIASILGPRFEEQQDTEHSILRNKNKSSNYAYLEKLLCTSNNKYLSLRLMCLIAITQKLSETELCNFLHKFIHEFGYKYGYLQTNLYKAGFLNESNNSSSNITSLVNKLLVNDFYANTNRLKQINPDPSKIDVKSPSCCSYVFGGSYIPLVVQVCSMLLGNTPINDIKTKFEPLGPLCIENENAYPLQSRTLLLYVLGGVTYSEIAACNLLETLTGSSIMVCSDRIICGDDIVEAVMSLPS